MALIADYSTQHLGQPVTVPAAYWRVALLQGNPTLMSVKLDVYRQQQDVGKEAPLASEWVHFEPDLVAEDNLFQQAYAAIMQRPEFAGATAA